MSDYMWYCEDESQPVATRLANPFGLFDMNGNVSEWCQDYWHDNYAGAPPDGSWWDSPTSSYRVFRGGGGPILAWHCRSAMRNRLWPDYRNKNIGFRVVLPISSSAY